MTKVISIAQISKSYQLVVIGSGAFADDLRIWWAKTSVEPNPLLRIGEKDNSNRAGE
jgi:hypothetical protein